MNFSDGNLNHEVARTVMGDMASAQAGHVLFPGLISSSEEQRSWIEKLYRSFQHHNLWWWKWRPLPRYPAPCFCRSGSLSAPLVYFCGGVHSGLGSSQPAGRIPLRACEEEVSHESGAGFLPQIWLLSEGCLCPSRPASGAVLFWRTVFLVIRKKRLMISSCVHTWPPSG